MDEQYELVQLDSEHGGFYLNSSPDLATLIAAGRQLAQDYPGTDYGVQTARDGILWASNRIQQYTLVRVIGELDQLLAPGIDPVMLMELGMRIGTEHVDWTLAVRDSERRIIWSNEKSVPGKAEDTPQKNG